MRALIIIFLLCAISSKVEELNKAIKENNKLKKHSRLKKLDKPYMNYTHYDGCNYHRVDKNGISESTLVHCKGRTDGN